MRFTFLKQEDFVFDSKNLSELIELYAIETCFLGIIIFIFTFAYTYILNFIAERQVGQSEFSQLMGRGRGGLFAVL